MNWSGLAQLFLGFVFGLALFLGAGVGAGYLFFSRLQTEPERPDFTPEAATVAASDNAVEAEADAATPAPEPSSEVTEVAEPEPEPELEPEPEPEEPTIAERFGENAYRAQVTWPEGLSLRAGPTYEAETIGGVQVNDELVIIGTSADGVWQQVFVPATGAQAWVKAGNVRRLEEPAAQ